jgi:hypothetical protein
LHQRLRLGDRRHLEPFGKVNGPDAPGLGLNRGDIGELPWRGTSGLVDHHILARAHRLYGKRGAVARDGGDDDKRHIGAVEQGTPVGTRGMSGNRFTNPASVSGAPSVHHPAQEAPAASRCSVMP